ncbi:lamin tail domain-containing protein, partial [Rathayibacter sp. ZW T2_19]
MNDDPVLGTATPFRRRRRSLAVAARSAAAIGGLALVAAPLVAAPASAAPSGDELVISEVFARGGSAGAVYSNRFVELHNPTGSDIALGGTSLQYRSATGTANPTTTIALQGTVPAGGHFLVQGASNGTNGAALPAPDQIAGGLNLAAAGGTVFLVEGTAPLVAPPTGASPQPEAVLDTLGYGTSNTFETAAAPVPTLTESLSRADGTAGDTDVNSADFTVGAATPRSSGGGTLPTPGPTTAPTT